MWLSSTSGYSLPRLDRHVAPELGAFQHVHLVDRADLPVALARRLEGHAQDAADLALGVMHGVEAEALLLPVDLAQLDAARLAEVDVAGQFAHDQDVQPGHDLRLEGRGVGQFRIQDRRAQVGEQAELLADAQQAALRPLLARVVVPLRAADGAEQHGIGRLRSFWVASG
jgi:hypothetical protein